MLRSRGCEPPGLCPPGSGYRADWPPGGAIATRPETDGNLVVGWSDSADRTSGVANGLVIRSSGGDNAQLCLATPGRPVLVDGFPNLPLQVVTVQLAQGTLVLAATLANAARLPQFGQLRPLGVIAQPAGRWAVLQQAVLGQVGWSVDTTVVSVDVDLVPDGFGPQPQPDTATYQFGDQVLTGGPLAEAPGLLLVEDDAAAALRIGDDGSGWLVSRREGVLSLERWAGGAAVESWEADRSATGAVEVLDDGSELRVLAGDALAIGPVLHHANASCTAVAATEGSVLHIWPRILECPAALLGPRPALPNAHTPVIDQAFGAVEAPDLDGHKASDDAVWSRTIGSQPFALTARGLVLPPVDGRASRSGTLAKLREGSGVRTAYTVPWRHSTAALTADILPPGTGRHQGHGCRAGLIFVQDDDNALLVNIWLDDNYDGTSVSSFFRLGGHEEVFDAVWVNVGRRITWGRPTELTVACDGDNYLVSVDGRPVLHRAITTVYPRAQRLQLHRVGVVTNWEFGQDTGSTIRRFRALG